MDIYLQIHAIV